MTSKEYFKALKIVHFGLLAGQVLFVILAFILTFSGTFNQADEFFRNFFLVLVPIFLLGGIVASNLMFKSGLKTARSKNELMEKLNFYRSALVVRYALLEGPSFFSIVAYLLTGEILFLGMAILLILIFLFIRPSAEKAGNDLELDYAEKQILNGPNGVIE